MSPQTHEDRVGAMRRDSELRCAVALRDAGPGGVSEIARATGLSRPTVDAALVRLAGRGLVVEDTGGHSRGADAGRTGRPPRLHRFVSDAGYVLGVDVRADLVRIAVADLSGFIVSRVEETGTGRVDGAGRLRAIGSLADKAMRIAKVPRGRVREAVVAFPGVVGADGRVLASADLRDWEHLDIAEQLGNMLRFPVTLDNDIKIAALAEHRLGVAKLARDVIFFHLGSKISSGIVLDGRLRRGRHNAAGELSRANLRLPLDERGRILWSSAPDGRSVLAAAEEGNPEALAERGAFVEGLAELIALFAQGIDPDCVVVGGPLSQAGGALFNPLRAAVARHTGLPIEWQIHASTLGSDVIIMGALSRAYELGSRRVFDADDVPAPKLRDRFELLDAGVIG